MGKWLFILLFGLLNVFLVSATCQTNNNFETGEDFNVCTSTCKFYNSTGQYQDCTTSIKCYLSMAYPNGTFLGFFKSMQFNAFGDEIFNYSFGNITNSIVFPSGIYQGQINCHSSYGFSDPINFEASVSSVEEPIVSDAGDGYPFTITLNSLEFDYKEEWCFDLEYEIAIKPVDLDGNLTEILVMDYDIGDADFLQTGGLYKEGLIYYITFYPDSSKTNFTEENIIISVQANQWGKVVSEDVNILVTECTSFEKTIESTFTKISNFWSNNKLLVCIILSVILIFIIAVVIYLKKKH